MESTLEFETLSRLIAAQLTRGLSTNSFLPPETYRQEIQAGTLMHHAWPGGLLMLRKRQGFQILNFYLQQTQLDTPLEPKIDIPSQTVLELPIRPGKQEEADRVLAFWHSQGFSNFLKRIRLVRMPTGITSEDMASGIIAPVETAPVKTAPVKTAPVETAPIGMKTDQTPSTDKRTGKALPEGKAFTPFSIFPASQGKFSSVQDLLEISFDKRTGCLPTQDALAVAIGEGHVLLALGADGTPGGVVHFKCTPAVMEIRHLAVHPDCRGQGLAKRLVMKALEGREMVRAQVWTGADNGSALAVYASCGYVPDGWTSEVWMKP